ncbi:hypothetical protein FQZ97_265860 [compost metagenome]
MILGIVAQAVRAAASVRPVYVAHASTMGNSVAFSVPLPSGYSAGQLAVLVIAASTSAAISLTGWTPVGMVSGSGIYQHRFYKILVASEPAVTVPAAGRRVAMCYTFAAGTFDPVVPFSGLGSTAGTGTSATPAAPAGAVSVLAGQYLQLSLACINGASTAFPATYPWGIGNAAQGVGTNPYTSALGSIAEFDGGAVVPAAPFGVAGSVAWVATNMVIRGSTYDSGIGYLWTLRTTPADYLWFGSAWSAPLGLFVAVTTTGTATPVMTSPDGAAWTLRSAAMAASAVCWSDTHAMFAAVGGTGDVCTSVDGVTWVGRSAPNVNARGAITASAGRFVAVGSGGTGNRVLTSDDGIAWVARTSAADNVWRSVCWSSELGLFVAVASSGTGNRVMTSPDGIAWTIRSSAADNDWRSVCWSPELGLFVAVASSGTGNRVMTSPDGIAWTLQTTPADNDWVAVTWAPARGLFVATSTTGTGNRVMVSPDGVAWVTRPTPADNSWLSVTWSPELNKFVSTATTGTGNRVMTSP